MTSPVLRRLARWNPVDRQQLKAELAWHSGSTSRSLRSAPDGLYIFNFHRIGDAAGTAFDPNVFSCSAPALNRHIAVIRNHFELITPQDLPSLMGGGKRGRYALLTFDDGYRDNYSEALPVLVDNGVSALFFICTGFIDSREPPWWDKVAFMVRHSAQTEISLNGQRIRIAGQKSATAIRDVLREFKLLSTATEEKLLMLQELLKPQINMPEDSLFMTWDELAEVKAAGIVIGSHTLRHDKLSHLSRQEQEQELRESKRLLDSRLDQDTVHLAYPVGGLDSFTRETQQIAGDTGYRYAFTTEQHLNSGASLDPLALGRFSVSAEHPASTQYAMLNQLNQAAAQRQ